MTFPLSPELELDETAGLLEKAWDEFLAPWREQTALRFSLVGSPDEVSVLSRLPTERRQEFAGIHAEKRRCEWLRARQGETAIAERLGQDPGCRSRLKMSVSHSGASLPAESHVVLVAGALLMDGAAVLGIGVDIESRARNVALALAPRIGTPEEYALGYSPLQLWSIKEACFKATPNNSGLTISSFRVTENCGRAWLHHASRSPISLAFRLLETPSLQIAFAVSFGESG